MSAMPPKRLRDPDLADIAAKVAAGERLDHADGMRLCASRDIFAIGRMANLVRERLHGRDAFYNVNRHINYTNVCILRCRFCSFRRSHRTARTGAGPDPDDGGYVLSVEEVVRQASEAYHAGATEVHIVGGLHPTLPFSYYLDMCRGIRRTCPRIHIKAFTAVEIIHFTRIARPRLSVHDVLERLRDAGLDSLPGGGAEIFDDRVHDEAFRAKVGEHGWFDVHRVAHEMGIFSNATMLYGHIERPAERIAHLLKLRDHQDASLRHRRAHFNCMVPLPFVPERTGFASLPGPTGLDSLKTLAICRLMLDNIPHIKAFWVMQGPKLAQVSLNWGVDDIDGTVVRYGITRGGGRDEGRRELTPEQLRRLIVEAGCNPVERDTLYRPIVR